MKNQCAKTDFVEIHRNWLLTTAIFYARLSRRGFWLSFSLCNISQIRSDLFQPFESNQTLVVIVMSRWFRKQEMKSYLICETNNRIAGTAHEVSGRDQGLRLGFSVDPAHKLPVFSRKARVNQPS